MTSLTFSALYKSTPTPKSPQKSTIKTGHLWNSFFQLFRDLGSSEGSLFSSNISLFSCNSSIFSCNTIFFNFQLFREELERVVGDSMRESGTEGISALLSDVMNIKNGSELYFLKMSKFWSKNIFAKKRKLQ